MNKIKLSAICCLLTFVITSCHVKQQIPYFNDIAAASDMTAKAELAETVIEPNDMLSIIVSALDPIAAAPFNLPIYSNLAQGSTQLTTTGSLQTYLVNSNGEIQFPVLGTLKIGGMTRNEVISYLQGLLSAYLKNPIVNINIVNYKISILGEVERPGQYTIGDERVTILDALALAGDMTIYGKRNTVLVIRMDEQGNKTAERVDLTQKDLFDSPYFFLKQNDIVYVEPNKTKALSSRYSPNLNIIISAIATAISAATLIYTLTK